MVQERIDRERGCGWRKPGGLYLVADGPSDKCGRLPTALHRCPTCDHGIKPSRGWTWVDGDELLDPCGNFGRCGSCPLRVPQKCGLLWVGEAFYETAAEYSKEAIAQGISRRISRVPRGFVIGETVVLLAHRRAIPQRDGKRTPGIFQAFIPRDIEYVVKGDETEEELAAIMERGIVPVSVKRDLGGLPGVLQAET